MKTKPLFTLAFILIVSFSSLFAQNADYDLVVSVFTKGTYKIWEYKLNYKSVTVTRFSTNGDAPEVVFEKRISMNEGPVFDELLGDFPYETVKDKYINPEVEGENHYEITVRHQHKSKQVYVYFEYPSELKILIDALNTLLPENYQLVFE
ncbi:MAG: hypothetical protein KBB11_05450 [Bacteroidales bacterium]|nr:hypothetical protein [Bacteroidales bacterium]HOY39067.1 hypothetical protein [Bacteroidales bacterium]HQN93444.1 hypothetical protein [Prolixibacteraceae bacterium]